MLSLVVMLCGLGSTMAHSHSPVVVTVIVGRSAAAAELVAAMSYRAAGTSSQFTMTRWADRENHFVPLLGRDYI